MTESANKDCVQRHFEELWNHGQIDKVDEFFSMEFSNFGVPQELWHGHAHVSPAVSCAWHHDVDHLASADGCRSSAPMVARVRPGGLCRSACE